MTFHELAQVFYAVAQESSRLKVTELLAAVFRKASSYEARIIAYLTLGTIRAPYQGVQFNFAEKNITRVLAELLDQDLEAYKKLVKASGDIGSSILTLQWPFSTKNMSLEYIYNQLIALEALSGVGAQEEKARLLKQLLQQVDALSASYIIRIINGTMRLGFSEMTVLDALSWMLVGNKSLHKQLEQAYTLCADLGLIAYSIKQEGIEGIQTIKLTVGIPLRPAGAERLPTPTAIIEKIGPCIAQPKLDGFRVQIHLSFTDKEPKIWFFSRNLLDTSAMFPDLRQALIACTHETMIIEGEAIVYNPNTDKFLPFQETVKRKRKHDIEDVLESLPLYLFLFDIIYYNGESLLDKPYHERRALLIKLFTRCASKYIRVIQEHYVSTSAELTCYFNQAIQQGFEGIVVKRPDAPYQAGKRNFNWIKLKRHEEGHVSDTIDAVVVGYYTGKGKRTHSGIGAFLVAVYNPQKDRFETIAKIGTGLTDSEWKDLKNRCDHNATQEQPHNIYCSPELVPDVWVQPVIVAVIRADEITQSPLHTAGRTESSLGFALRFPRFMGYSVDKTSTQATTVQEIQELYKQQFSL